MLDSLSQSLADPKDVSVNDFSPQKSRDPEFSKEILEGAVTNFWEWYPDEDRCEFSSGFSKTLGISNKITSLTRAEWLAMIEPDDVPRVVMAMRNHLSSGGRLPYKLEIRYLHKGGGSIWMLSTARTVERAADGHPTKMIGTHIDISDRKRLEENLRSVMEALDNRNEELASYSFITAHDLRSPVTSIVALMDLYNQEPTAENSKFVLDSIGGLARDLLDTMDTLNEVLNVKRRPDVVIEPVLLAPVFEGVRETFSKRIESLQAIVEAHFDNCPSVPGYAPYIESILRNLLSNSLRFNSPDRVPKIRVESEQFKSHFVIRVADNGIGIDMSRHGRKLFGLKQRFHQAEGCRGVGLFMIKAQIEAMKGSITVSSRVDEGTIFTVYLPNNS
jgi:PAS domain S-box-containing protein